MKKTTITITITEENKKERQPIYNGILFYGSTQIVAQSTSYKRVENYMTKKYKGKRWWIEKVENV